MRRRTVLHLLLLLGALGRAPLSSQVPGTVVFAVGEDPTLPLPALTDRRRGTPTSPTSSSCDSPSSARPSGPPATTR